MEQDTTESIEAVQSDIKAPSRLGKKNVVIAIGTILLFVLISGGGYVFLRNKTTYLPSESFDPNAPVPYQKPLVDVPFVRQEIHISPDVSKGFSLSEVKNIGDMEKTYGFTFSPAELKQLETQKFVTKNLTDTNIPGAQGLPVYENKHEMVALYSKVSGNYDYKERSQANALFISADSMMNLFSVLSADLLKETENKYLVDQTSTLTKTLFDQATIKLGYAVSADDKKQWKKVRDYLAVPYALLSTSEKPLDVDGYYTYENKNPGTSAEQIQADFQTRDAQVDQYEKTAEFVRNLKLGADEETAVLADIKKIYDAGEDRGVPSIFAEEFAGLPATIQPGVSFTVFKPRGSYTSSSLRRQYFRAVQWYQQIPFYQSSTDLTHYAVDIGELVHANKDIESQYKEFSSLIAFVVGESDDLDVSDYAAAAQDLGRKDHDTVFLSKYLDARKPESKIKSTPVTIDPKAGVTVADELHATRGMRFMSQKFIPDSYWTSKLTQGDEAPAVNGQRLPDKASVLEVMSILGSPYATSHLSDLPFYKDHSQAIDTRRKELATEASGWSEGYWKSNLYTSTLWTLSGMFNWSEANRALLPSFMQSPQWDAKTLLTASGFWTELRHTSILYAKASFAEKGGGGSDSCDLRKVPEPAKGYVEPQAEAYDRMYYLAQRMAAEYTARGYKLENQKHLVAYIHLLENVREYTKLELENNTFPETVISQTRHSEDDNTDCKEYLISPDSAVVRGKDPYENPVAVHIHYCCEYECNEEDSG